MVRYIDKGTFLCRTFFRKEIPHKLLILLISKNTYLTERIVSTTVQGYCLRNKSIWHFERIIDSILRVRTDGTVKTTEMTACRIAYHKYVIHIKAIFFLVLIHPSDHLLLILVPTYGCDKFHFDTRQTFPLQLFYRNPQMLSQVCYFTL